MTGSSSLMKLTELAKETSSERRRELLRDVTDLYFATQNTCSDIESQYFDEILTTVISAMNTEVRKEMAIRLASEPVGPRQCLRQLANDEIDIAGPVLRHSPILQDKDLCNVIDNSSQQHMRSISSRDTLSTNVTRNLVEKGDDKTLITLASNQGARFDRQSMETLVTRSEAVTALQGPLVEHRDLPPDLMNEMYMFAEQTVRGRILFRNENIDPAVLEKAIAQSKRQTSGQNEDLPENFRMIKNEINILGQKGSLDGASLVKFERAGDRLRFCLGVSKLSKVEYSTIERILQRQDMDALALICRAIDFDASLFVTIALLVFDEEKANTGNAHELKEMFQNIPANAAKRTLRFWQMRQKIENEKVA